VIIIFSHGGRNAAPIEVALGVKAKGVKVISVSSQANMKVSRPSHSSGKFLSELADIAIDNCVPPEDALVDVGQPEKVGAGSTVAAVSVAMSLVTETGARLAKQGKLTPTFVSPNVPGVAPDHNDLVYEAFTRFFYSRPLKPLDSKRPRQGQKGSRLSKGKVRKTNKV